MTRLHPSQVLLLRKCPFRDVVLRDATPTVRLVDLAHLRQRGLITIAIDWDGSSRTEIHRTIELTPAGLDALRTHRDVI